MAARGGSLGPKTAGKANLSIFSHVRWEHCAAGVSGGVVSTLVLHPLDLIKIRFQVNEGGGVEVANRPQYRGVIHAFRSIHTQQGVRGLYQGVAPNVWGAGASWGLYFLFYNALKTWMQEGDETVSLSATAHMIAATEAGVATLVITNPIWVAKTRLCLQYDAVKSTKPGDVGVIHYRGLADCLAKTYSMEGMKGLYRGFIPGMVGVSHGSLQFMAYEELKKMYNNYRGVHPNTKFSSTEYLCFAAISKIFAASTTYPYQVVRSRLQDHHRHYDGVMDVCRQTWRYEGLRGFYKGLAPYLVHVTPNICIVFLIYEKVTAPRESKTIEEVKVKAGPKSGIYPSFSPPANRDKAQQYDTPPDSSSMQGAQVVTQVAHVAPSANLDTQKSSEDVNKQSSAESS